MGIEEDALALAAQRDGKADAVRRFEAAYLPEMREQYEEQAYEFLRAVKNLGCPSTEFGIVRTEERRRRPWEKKNYKYYDNEYEELGHGYMYLKSFPDVYAVMTDGRYVRASAVSTERGNRDGTYPNFESSFRIPFVLFTASTLKFGPPVRPITDDMRVGLTPQNWRGRLDAELKQQLLWNRNHMTEGLSKLV